MHVENAPIIKFQFPRQILDEKRVPQGVPHDICAQMQQIQFDTLLSTFAPCSALNCQIVQNKFTQDNNNK